MLGDKFTLNVMGIEIFPPHVQKIFSLWTWLCTQAAYYSNRTVGPRVSRKSWERECFAIKLPQWNQLSCLGSGSINVKPLLLCKISLCTIAFGHIPCTHVLDHSLISGIMLNLYSNNLQTSISISEVTLHHTSQQSPSLSTPHLWSCYLNLLFPALHERQALLKKNWEN